MSEQEGYERISERRLIEFQVIYPDIVEGVQLAGGSIVRLWESLTAERLYANNLESAAIDAARFLQRKEAGQCANELAAQLWAAINGTTGEGE